MYIGRAPDPSSAHPDRRGRPPHPRVDAPPGPSRDGSAVGCSSPPDRRLSFAAGEHLSTSAFPVSRTTSPGSNRCSDSVSSGDAFLDEVTTHLIAAGGKRLRPAWPSPRPPAATGRRPRTTCSGPWPSSSSTWPRCTTTTYRRGPDPAQRRERQHPFRQPRRHRRRRLPPGPLRRDRRRRSAPRSPPSSPTPSASSARARSPRSAPSFQHRPDRGRLLHRHRRQDRRAHGHVVPDRRPHRRPRPSRGRRADPVRPLLRDGLPAPRRRPRHRRHATRSSASRPARIWPRGSTRCPCCWRCADPDTGRELADAARPAARPTRTGQGAGHRRRVGRPSTRPSPGRGRYVDRSRRRPAPARAVPSTRPRRRGLVAARADGPAPTSRARAESGELSAPGAASGRR